MSEMGNKSCVCGCFYGVITPDLTTVDMQGFMTRTTPLMCYYQTLNS